MWNLSKSKDYCLKQINLFDYWIYLLQINLIKWLLNDAICYFLCAVKFISILVVVKAHEAMIKLMEWHFACYRLHTLQNQMYRFPKYTRYRKNGKKESCVHYTVYLCFVNPLVAQSEIDRESASTIQNEIAYIWPHNKNNV